MWTLKRCLPLAIKLLFFLINNTYLPYILLQYKFYFWRGTQRNALQSWTFLQYMSYTILPKIQINYISRLLDIERSWFLCNVCHFNIYVILIWQKKRKRNCPVLSFKYLFVCIDLFKGSEYQFIIWHEIKGHRKRICKSNLWRRSLLHLSD